MAFPPIKTMFSPLKNTVSMARKLCFHSPETTFSSVRKTILISQKDRLRYWLKTGTARFRINNLAPHADAIYFPVNEILAE